MGLRRRRFPSLRRIVLSFVPILTGVLAVTIALELGLIYYAKSRTHSMREEIERTWNEINFLKMKRDKAMDMLSRVAAVVGLLREFSEVAISSDAGLQKLVRDFMASAPATPVVYEVRQGTSLEMAPLESIDVVLGEAQKGDQTPGASERRGDLPAGEEEYFRVKDVAMVFNDVYPNVLKTIARAESIPKAVNVQRVVLDPSTGDLQGPVRLGIRLSAVMIEGGTNR